MRVLLAVCVLFMAGDHLPAPGGVGCTRALRRMEGWTVLSVTSIVGEFEGCDFDRRIQLADGTNVVCASYGYQYGYQPDAILFGRRIRGGTGTGASLRLLVEDDIYDLLPALE